jgi:hypothetical protein
MTRCAEVLGYERHMNFSFVHITDHHLADSEAGLIGGFWPAFALHRIPFHIR